MLPSQIQSQSQPTAAPWAIVSLLFDVILLLVIYSIGALIAESWLALLWAGRTIARFVTIFRNMR